MMMKASVPIIEYSTKVRMFFLKNWADINDFEKIKNEFINNIDLLLKTDFDGNYLLHYATISGSLDLCSFIVQKFPDHQFYNSRRLTPSHFAADKNDVDMLRIFQKSNVMMTALSSKKWSPLHFAIYKNNFESVKFLVDNKINDINGLIIGNEYSCLLNFPQLNFVSPFDLSVIVYGNDKLNISNDTKWSKITEYLYNNGALPSFHASVYTNDFQAVTFFTESKKSHYISSLSPFFNKEQNINSLEGIRKESVLHIAAERGNLRICRYLLHNPLISTDVYNYEGMSPLDISIKHDFIIIASALFPKSSKEQQINAVFMACDLRKTDFLNEMFKLMPKESFSAYSKNKETILIRLILRNLLSTVETMLEIDSESVNMKDSRGATALHYASALSDEKTVTLLIKAKANPSELDANGLSPMMYSLLSQNSKNISILSKYNPYDVTESGFSAFSLNMVLMFPKDRNEPGPPKLPHSLYPLKIPKVNNVDQKYSININIIIKIISAHKIIFSKAQNPENIASNKINENDKKTINEKGIIDENDDDSAKNEIDLISPKIRVFIDTFRLEKLRNRVFENVTILHLASIAKSHYGAQMVMAVERNLIFEKDSMGQIPFYYAIKFSRTETVQSMINEIKYRPDLLEGVDDNGNTCFHFINSDFLFSFVDSIRYLIIGCLNLVNNKGQTVFHMLCKHNCFRILSLLLNNNTNNNNINILFLKDGNGLTVSDYAFKFKSFECIELLNSFGVENMLIKAIKENNMKEINSLIDNNFPIISFDKSNMTPLHYAASQSNLEILKMLLSKSEETKSALLQNSSGLQPIHYAAKANSWECIIELLPHSALLSNVQRPFMFSTDIKCRNFLYNSWKRSIYLKRIKDLLISRNLLIRGTIKILQKPASINYYSRYPMFISFTKVCQRMIFICEHYNFSQKKAVPLQHLLGLFETIEIHEAINDLLTDLKPFLTSHKTNSLFPFFMQILVWVIDSYYLIKCVSEHQLQQLYNDDSPTISYIVDHMKKQAAICLTSFETIFKITEVINHLSSIMLLPNSKLIGTGIYISAPVTIKECVPTYLPVFPRQSDSIINQFFPFYILSRYIPFQRNTICSIALSKDYLILSSQVVENNNNNNTLGGNNNGIIVCKSYIVPIALISFNKIAKNLIKILTPNGSLTISFDKTCLFAAFLNELSNRLLQLTGHNEGMALFQENKNHIYQCLVAFPTMNNISLRSIMVNAGKKDECYDICKDHIVEMLGFLPSRITVLPKKINSTSEDLIII